MIIQYYQLLRILNSGTSYICNYPLKTNDYGLWTIDSQPTAQNSRLPTNDS